MNKKLQRMIGPVSWLFVLLMAAFAVATYFYSPTLAYIEAGVVVVLLIYGIVASRRRKRELLELIQTVTYDAESAKNNTLMNFPLPIVVFKMQSSQVVWGNQIFFNLFGGARPSYEVHLDDLVPGMQTHWLMEGKSRRPGLTKIGERKYQIHGNLVRTRDQDLTDPDLMGITYWVDVTDYDNIKQEYDDSRPIIMILLVDNYDELMKNLTDRAKADLMGRVEDIVSQWCAGKEGLLNRFDRDRYMFLFENRHLPAMREDRFSLLESIHTVVNASGIHATLSIGMGLGGSFEEDMSLARLSLDMALSRGGDQAVIKNRDGNFDFYGGRGADVGVRSKVKSRSKASALASLIQDSSQVYVMGHKLADMDAVGAAVGMACICRKLERSVRIVVDPEKNASKKLIAQVRTSPEYQNMFIREQEALDWLDESTLLIVVDTNRPEQVDGRTLLDKCGRVAVIDHHRRAADYIENAALTFHEPYASSACELVSELMQVLLEPSDVTRTEAEALLAGIVLDTKNFTLRTGESTFEAAAFLERLGADPSAVKLLLQNDMEHTVQKYGILQNAKIYRDGIAIAISDTEQDRVVAAQAADEMLNISGIQASFVLYATAEGGVVVSARSFGEVNAQMILEKLGGGGNKSAAGAQVKHISLRDAVNTLCASIDEYVDNRS